MERLPLTGGPSRIRTDDLRITSALLWPTELSGHIGGLKTTLRLGVRYAQF